MTKKKQRKGRAKKEAARKNQEPEDQAHVVVYQNVQLQKWNTVLQPLYAILTSLELKINSTDGVELLQKINLQDYDQEGERSYSYSIDKTVSLMVSVILELSLALPKIKQNTTHLF